MKKLDRRKGRSVYVVPEFSTEDVICTLYLVFVKPIPRVLIVVERVEYSLIVVISSFPKDNKTQTQHINGPNLPTDRHYQPPRETHNFASSSSSSRAREQRSKTRTRTTTVEREALVDRAIVQLKEDRNFLFRNCVVVLSENQRDAESR